jgi:hypothetical protein
MSHIATMEIRNDLAHSFDNRIGLTGSCDVSSPYTINEVLRVMENHMNAPFAQMFFSYFQIPRYNPTHLLLSLFISLTLP